MSVNPPIRPHFFSARVRTLHRPPTYRPGLPGTSKGSSTEAKDFYHSPPYTPRRGIQEQLHQQVIHLWLVMNHGCITDPISHFLRATSRQEYSATTWLPSCTGGSTAETIRRVRPIAVKTTSIVIPCHQAADRVLTTCSEARIWLRPKSKRQIIQKMPLHTLPLEMSATETVDSGLASADEGLISIRRTVSRCRS